MSIENTRLPRMLLLLLALAGCTPTLREGQFTCGPDIDCPAGFTCRSSDMLCYRASDGGTAPVDGGAEAGTPDVPSDVASDGGRDGCGPNCIQLIVLNADPDAVGSVDFVDNTGVMQRISIPPYGTSSATLDVHNVTIPGTLSVNVPPTITRFHELDVPAEGRYLLALGPASVGANVLLLPQPREGLHTDGYVYIQLIDMTVDETVGLIASGAGRNPPDRTVENLFDHDTISDVLPFLPGSTEALRLAIDPATPHLIGALIADRIPGTEGTYYVAVSGRVNAHLDTEEGLRFIPGIPGSTALKSSRLVRFIDTVGTDVTVCDGATRVASLTHRSLSAPIVPTTSSAWALTIHSGMDCSTGLTRDVAVGAATGRTLVSIAGDLATEWGAVSISEPIPPAGSNSTIVIHNALSTPASIAGAAMIPSLGTASVTVVSPPPSITASTMDLGTKTFSWSPMERQSWVVVTAPGGPTLTAFEIDSPFRTPWTVTPAVSD